MKLLDTSCPEEFMQWAIVNGTQERSVTRSHLIRIVSDEVTSFGVPVKVRINNWFRNNIDWLVHHISIIQQSRDLIEFHIAGYYWNATSRCTNFQWSMDDNIFNYQLLLNKMGTI